MNKNRQKVQINSPKVDILPILSDSVECKISMLRYLLSAIKKWEDIAQGEFSILKKEYIKKNPKGFSYVDPIDEESFVMHMTGLALYGSLSVNIAALVENELKNICDIKKDNKDNKDNKTTLNNKPSFADYLTFLGFGKSARGKIKHYKNHLFIRELANRFKHDGGRITSDFIKQYEKDLDLTVAIDIQYDELPWDKYIKETEEFLLDIVNRGIINVDESSRRSSLLRDREI